MRATSPLQQTFRLSETRTSTRAGTTRAMPDDRILLTLDDGRSFLIDGKHLRPQSDGTYHVQLDVADELDKSPSEPGQS